MWYLRRLYLTNPNQAIITLTIMKKKYGTKPNKYFIETYEYHLRGYSYDGEKTRWFQGGELVATTEGHPTEADYKEIYKD